MKAIFAIFLLFCQLSFAQAAKKTIAIDGSSTVFPITEAIAEEFNAVEPKIRVTIGVSGTGGGFKKFTKGEIDINDASREIKSKEKIAAKKNGIKYIELPVAYDGLTVVVNPKNTWAKELTTAQLKKLWQPGSKVKTWKDLNAEWPNKPIKLYGPGPDSGTFDYFTKAIVGKSGASRADYTKSEDDHVLVKGVQGDINALGYFGYAYYEENKKKLKSVAINNGKGAVKPTMETIKTGKYAPLSRPIFIYVSKKAGQKPETKKFVNFYMDQAGSLVKEVGYIPLQKHEYAKYKKKFNTFVK